MKVTMLYFDTICTLVKEYGFTWRDVNGIEDNDKRVVSGVNNEFTSSLEDMFYVSHIGGHWEDYRYRQNIIDAFVEALSETRTCI